MIQPIIVASRRLHGIESTERLYVGYGNISEYYQTKNGH